MWKARLGIESKTGILKQHWRRTQAFARRFSEGRSDEFGDLKPLAELHKQLQVFSEFARDISMHLLIPLAERMQDEALQGWHDAYHFRGKNATFRRAMLIRSSIFEKIAPLLGRTPDASKFMNDIIRLVRNAAERHYCSGGL
jgi:hypothetical protein